MGLNRMMMKSNKNLKDIEAEMTVGNSGVFIGFIDDSGTKLGQLSPNPLPNGVRVSFVVVALRDTAMLQPTTIKSCTLKEIGITVTHNASVSGDVMQYLSNKVGKVIPIILHF